MKKYYWYGFFFFLSNFLCGQDNFSNVINILNHNEYAHYIHSIDDDAYFIFGGGIDQIEPEFIGRNYILSYNSEEQNINYFDSITSERAGNYTIHNDTFYYLGLYSNDQYPLDICLFKSDLKTNPIFLNRSVYKTSKDIIYPKRMCFDDKYIYTINRERFEKDGITYNVGKFLKLDFSGKLISEEYYDEIDNVIDYPEDKNHFNYFRDIDLLSDSTLIISFLYSPFVSDDYGALYKTDLDGNILWLKTFEPSEDARTLPESLVLKDGTIIYQYVADYRDTLVQQRPYRKPPIVYHLDSEGNILWEYVFETFPSWHWKSIGEIIQAKNGDIIGVGEYYGTDISSLSLGWIFRMDLDGNVLWEHLYFDENYTGDSWFNDVKEMNNGDLILAGSIDNDVDGEWNNNGYGWVLRVDGDGCFYPGCSNIDTLQIIKANYHDSIPVFCPKGAKWTYGTVDGRWTGQLIYGYETMTYSKDTLIDQNHCKIISRYHEDNYGETELESIIIHQDRQKIYQYYEESFHLLFDFGFTVGDTIKLDLWKDWFGNNEEWDGTKREGEYFCRVDSINSRIYNGEELKEFSCTLMCYDDPLNPTLETLSDGIHFKITERFFMIDGYWLFNTYACSKDQSIFHDLRCYEDDAFGFIRFEDIECDSILTKTQNTETDSEVLLYPNPVNNKIVLYLGGNHKWSKWALFQMDGRLIKKGKIEQSQQKKEINVANLDCEVYVVKLISEEGEIKILKFIKE